MRAKASLCDLTLCQLSLAESERLAAVLAEMDPWRRLSISRQGLLKTLEAEKGISVTRICRGAETAGVMVIQELWLLGPYLKLLAVLPRFQRCGVGAFAMARFERLALDQNSRNAWLCVSEHNQHARAFYERSGYVCVGRLEALIVPDEAELLMRKVILR